MSGDWRSGPSISYKSLDRWFRFLASRYARYSVRICLTVNLIPHVLHTGGSSRDIR
jgi:hypothetical protein